MNINSPQAVVTAEAGGDHSVHTEARIHPKGTHVEDPNNNSKVEHGHLGYWTSRIAMEHGGVNHQYLPEVKCPPT